MIDEKEKQDGMRACFDHRVDDKVEREFTRDPLIAYTRAFDDAIDWFKKAIWHDASEMPEKGKAFIFLAESNSSKHYHVGVVYDDESRVIITEPTMTNSISFSVFTGIIRKLADFQEEWNEEHKPKNQITMKIF